MLYFWKGYGTRTSKKCSWVSDVQIHKCTNTQIYKYTNTQVNKYKVIRLTLLIAILPASDSPVAAELSACCETWDRTFRISTIEAKCRCQCLRMRRWKVWLRNCGKLDFIATRLRPGSKRKTREIWMEKLKQSNLWRFWSCDGIWAKMWLPC